MREGQYTEGTQFTLGKLLKILKTFDLKDKEGRPMEVEFSFEGIVPTEFGSWRGSYNECRLGFESRDYSHRNDSEKDMTLSKFIKLVEKEIGTVETGWKGGDFMMTEDTPVWVSNEGCAYNNIIVDVYRHAYLSKIVLVIDQSQY